MMWFQARSVIWNKARSESGETMVETLVSVLICALSLMMLATAIGASINLVLSSKDAIQAMYADESDMVKSDKLDENPPGTPYTVTFGIPLSATTDPDTGVRTTTAAEIVSAYANADKTVAFYER